jgi:hypothetical protein
MGKGRQIFRQKDATRAVKAALAAGLTVTAMIIREGEIKLLFGEHGISIDTSSINEWDKL